MEIQHISLANYQQEVSKSDRPVLLDFYADWCAPCRAFAGEIAAFAAKTDRVKVGKINVDESGDLAMTYGVMSIPTLVLVQDGQEVARRVGGGEVADIESFVAENLGAAE